MPQPGYEGFAKLGDVLFGGPQRRAEEAYPKYLKQAADGASALDRAAIVRAQRIARDNLPAAIAADPTLAQHGDLATAVLGMSTGQPNLSTFTGGLADIADLELDRQIREKLDAGDVAGAQRLSAVKTDKVLPTLEAGGKAVFTPITGEAAMTPLGDAAIGAEDALAQQRLADAGADAARGRAYDAQADLRNRTDPNRKTNTGGKFGFQVEAIEADLGRNLTPRELQDLAEGKLNIQVPEPATLGDAIEPVASPAPREAEVLQAINDARRAIATGRISREAARKRLIDAGMVHAAERI